MTRKATPRGGDPLSIRHAVTHAMDRRSALALEPKLEAALDLALVGVRGKAGPVVLVGPPGNLRDGLAESLAAAATGRILRVDLQRAVSKYIGETEKNLSALFDTAEADGAVLVFDEADALFGKRSEVRDAHDRYANLEVSYLLDRAETFEGLVILAANLKSEIDAAISRRLGSVLRLG